MERLNFLNIYATCLIIAVCSCKSHKQEKKIEFPTYYAVNCENIRCFDITPNRQIQNVKLELIDRNGELELKIESIDISTKELSELLEEELKKEHLISQPYVIICEYSFKNKVEKYLGRLNVYK